MTYRARAEQKQESAVKAEAVYYVVTVTAYPEGAFTRSEPIRFASKASATTACEQLQADFDADCDPCRAYVLDHDFVPVRAGGERRVRPVDALYAA